MIVQPHWLPALVISVLGGCAPIAKWSMLEIPQRRVVASRRLSEIFACYFEAYLELFLLCGGQIGACRYGNRLTIDIIAQQGSAVRRKCVRNFSRHEPFSFCESANDHSRIDWGPTGIDNPSNPLLVTLLPLRLIFPTLIIFGPRSSLFFSSRRCH